MDCKILIVEDDARLREVLCDYFRSKGENPTAAADGMEALRLLGESDFDAVLLDIMMPELDGLSVCRAVRRTNDVPIIFLTALSAEEDKLLGYELGADDYVTKPFTMSVLYAKTMALIRRSRRSVLAGDRIEAGGITLEDSTHPSLTPVVMHYVTDTELWQAAENSYSFLTSDVDRTGLLDWQLQFDRSAEYEERELMTVYITNPKMWDYETEPLTYSGEKYESLTALTDALDIPSRGSVYPESDLRQLGSYALTDLLIFSGQT